MNPHERIRRALEELREVRSNIERTAWALRAVGQEVFGGQVADWATIIESAIREVGLAQEDDVSQRLEDAKNGSAALLDGILGGVIVKPEVKP